MKLSSIVCASFVALALTASGAVAETTLQSSRSNSYRAGTTTTQPNGCPNGQAAGTVQGSENGTLSSYKTSSTGQPCPTGNATPQGLTKPTGHLHSTDSTGMMGPAKPH